MSKQTFGLSIVYSPMNCGWFLLWHGQLLQVFNTKQEAKAEMERLLSGVES